MAASIAIIDSGGANIASLTFALERLGVSAELTTDKAKIIAADKVILPGVGAAADAMLKLRNTGLTDVIHHLQQPVLGVCLGMQLLFETSEEDQATCLGIIPGNAKRFVPAAGRPVPHMGWNRVAQRSTSPIFDGIADGAHFYFVHSYALPVGPDSIGITNYGGEFTAVVEHRNFVAAQFHPERSGEAGARLLKNFVNHYG